MTDPNTHARTDTTTDTTATLAPPHEVPCGFGCGHLAVSEADLDSHEADCEDAWRPEVTAAPPRPVGSVRVRHGRRGGGA